MELYRIAKRLYMKLPIFLLSSLIIIVILAWNTQIISRTDSTLILTPIRSFYIPANKPLAVFSFDMHPQELQNIVNQLKSHPNTTFGVYIKNLNTGQEISLNPHKQFNSASLYKLAIMYAVYDLANQGKININDPVIQDNLKQMITASSNEAAFYFIENVVSWEEVTRIIQKRGLKDTTLSQDPPLTTPQDMGYLLELISTGKAINPQVSTQMLNLLSKQQINDRIPVMLPKGVNVAHKTGELDNVRHDAGIVFGPENNFILVLMSKNDQDPESVKPIMSQISLEVFDFFQKQWSNPPEIL